MLFYKRDFSYKLKRLQKVEYILNYTSKIRLLDRIFKKNYIKKFVFFVEDKLPDSKYLINLFSLPSKKPFFKFVMNKKGKILDTNIFDLQFFSWLSYPDYKIGKSSVWYFHSEFNFKYIKVFAKGNAKLVDRIKYKGKANYLIQREINLKGIQEELSKLAGKILITQYVDKDSFLSSYINYLVDVDFKVLDRDYNINLKANFSIK